MTSSDDPVLELVVAVKQAIFNVGGWWMSGEEEAAASKVGGLVDWQLYFLGRHGVLGDVDPEVAAASAYFFPIDHFEANWTAARAILTPEDAVERYSEVCHNWGRGHLAEFGAAERLAELSEKISDSVDIAGMPLFAGWRALPIPLDAPARAAHALQVLREHRGGCHGIAIVASRVSPLMAILANQEGAYDASEYGWQPPYPEVTDTDRQCRAAAEVLTDQLVADGYAVLTEAERGEFQELILSAEHHVGPQIWQ
jgi:hypothetical protein